MSWNTGSSYSKSFIQELDYNESDSGSGLSDMEDVPGLAVHSMSEDDSNSDLDLQAMIVSSRHLGGTIHSLSEDDSNSDVGTQATLDSSRHLGGTVQPLSHRPRVASSPEVSSVQNDPEARERSPLRSITSLRPEESSVELREDQSSETGAVRGGNSGPARKAVARPTRGTISRGSVARPTKGSSSRGSVARPSRGTISRGSGYVSARSRVPTRGRVSRGGYGGVSRRRATAAVNGVCGWRQGDQVLEVCCDDEIVPTSLSVIVNDLETARRLRSEQQEKRDRLRNLRANEEDNESEVEECYDASSVAHELFGGDRGAMEFEWSPMSTFSCRPEKFKSKYPGPNFNTSSAYDAFRQYWDDEILEHIVTETNRYAAELKSCSPSFARSWYDTNLHEVMILFAFWMMLGVIGMPSIKSCFSSHRLLKTDVFRSLMTENRYWDLNRALHFVNNATRTPNSHKLFSLGPLVKHLNTKFQEAYTLGQNITIDESLTLWKGNLAFRQYIKSKSARLGIKAFELCEAATGYMWSFVIYTGKDNEIQPVLPKSTEIVIRLMKPLLNKGHRLFMDNWFTSPLLARFLKMNKTDCVGTLRKSCKNLPALIQVASLPIGTCVARHSGDVMVMVYQDKRPVYMISTCHGSESKFYDRKPGRAAHYKPTVVADYNVSKGGVDKMDQMLSPYLIERKKNRKWYKKMFKRLLNISIFNSRILLDKSTPDVVKQQAFRLDLVDEIIEEHLLYVPQQRKCEILNRDSRLSNIRLSAVNSHFIIRSQRHAPDGRMTLNGQSVGRAYCRWCIVRLGRWRRTVYKCEQCDVFLCVDGCFKSFHTEP